MYQDIALNDVGYGKVFVLDGIRFVALNHSDDAVLVVTEDVVLRNIPFEDDNAERKDHNNYHRSNLQWAMDRWLRTEHPEILQATIMRGIDLTTMDGKADYGTPLTVVRALTLDEYRQHRMVLPLTSEPYWLATGWGTCNSPYSGADSAFYIYAVGSVNYHHVNYPGFAARPALFLKSSTMVSVESAGQKTDVLKQQEFSKFSKFINGDLLDLLDELRRLNQQDAENHGEEEKK